MPFNSKWEESFRKSWIEGLDRGKSLLEIGPISGGRGVNSANVLCSNMGISYTAMDVCPGIGITGDVHNLKGKIADESFDYVLSEQVWEHLRKPWVASAEVSRIVRDGGEVCILTPQTYHLHNFPGDYFRFSEAALASCFDSPEWSVVKTGSVYPCKITAPQELIDETGWSQGGGQAFLCVYGIFKRNKR